MHTLDLCRMDYKAVTFSMKENKRTVFVYVYFFKHTIIYFIICVYVISIIILIFLFFLYKKNKTNYY